MYFSPKHIYIFSSFYTKSLGQSGLISISNVIRNLQYASQYRLQAIACARLFEMATKVLR